MSRIPHHCRWWLKDLALDAAVISAAVILIWAVWP